MLARRKNFVSVMIKRGVTEEETSQKRVFGPINVNTA